ncbi:hypothetical protein ACLIYP_02270 [Streptomyces nanhaiensis]|uniref:hypothetical protein n=1 Tax=Streptomyces nanhaiensis TaxID=679319 RepID=UPI00399CB6DD
MPRTGLAAAACLLPLCLVLAGCTSTSCSGSAICGDGNGDNVLGDGTAGKAGEDTPGGLPGVLGGRGDGGGSKAAPGAVRFSGDVLIGDDFDLDHEPPGVSPSAGSVAYTGTDLYFYAMTMGGVAPMVTTAEWKEERAPGRRQCEEYLARFAIRDTVVEWSGEGTSFCARTDEGRIAFVRLGEKTGVGYAADVTVWEK